MPNERREATVPLRPTRLLRLPTTAASTTAASRILLCSDEVAAVGIGVDHAGPDTSFEMDWPWVILIIDVKYLHLSHLKQLPQHFTTQTCISVYFGRSGAAFDPESPSLGRRTGFPPSDRPISGRLTRTLGPPRELRTGRRRDGFRRRHVAGLKPRRRRVAVFRPVPARLVRRAAQSGRPAGYF